MILDEAYRNCLIVDILSPYIKESLKMKYHTKKRKYHSFNAKLGYPAGSNLFYECTGCGEVMPSFPDDSIVCSCRNISIDIDYGRISIKNHDLVKVFSIEGEA